MTNLFNGLFDSQTTTVISISDFLLCVGIALIAGLMIAICAKWRTDYSKSFFISLAVLPALVCVVIMMVNGNIGAGVAIAGAFALVRFRSSPGDAKQIALVFFSMASGLMAGMGYLAYTVLFTVIICIIFIIYTFIVNKNTHNMNKVLHITIPESLDYTDVFEDIFTEYTNYSQMTSVKTTNMGSMYKLSYEIKLKDITKEKQFIDALRCRNGNLEISISQKTDANNIL